MQKATAMTEKTRVQLDLLPSKIEAMELLMERCEFSTRKELFDHAISLFEWAVGAARDGKQVAIYDEAADHVERVHFPALTAAARKAEKARREKEGATAPTVVASQDTGAVTRNKIEHGKRTLRAISVA